MKFFLKILNSKITLLFLHFIIDCSSNCLHCVSETSCTQCDESQQYYKAIVNNSDVYCTTCNVSNGYKLT